MKKTLPQHDAQPRIDQLGLNQDGVLGCAVYEDRRSLVYDWHSHPQHHQLLYAVQGAMQVETVTARYFLPPRCALWIPAALPHRTWLDGVVKASAFLSPTLSPHGGDRVRVLTAPPLLREMLIHAATLPPYLRGVDDALVQSYYQTLGFLCGQWLDRERPFWLPRSDIPALVRVTDYVQANLADATYQQACQVAGMSDRTLRRHFLHHLGLGWQDYVTQSRLIRAMLLLEQPTMRIAHVAEEVGFANLGNFSRAFQAFCGQTPSRYRQSSVPDQPLGGGQRAMWNQ